MRTRFLPAPERRGSALVFSVMSVMVVSILAAGFLQLSMSVTRRLNVYSDTQQAINLAEAGLAEAYSGLAVARTGNVGTMEAPAVLGGGLLWVEAEHHASGLVELECTAMYGTGRATLGLVCEPVGLGVASLGFFTDEDLRLNPDVRLDSYDSKVSTYADQLNTALNNKGSIGSNGDVSVASGNTIMGDIVYGPTGQLSVASGSVITGGSSARPEEEVLPPVVVPDIPLQKAVKYTGGIPMVVPPGQAGYAGLDIGKNSTLILKGPLDLVVNSLILRLGAKLEFDTTNGPVQLFVNESLDFSTSSVVSTSTQVTSDSLIFVAAPEGKSVNFGAKSQFYGFIYAPNADVHISAQYELYGGLVCKELQLAAQGKMHYDLSLGATLSGQLPILHSWRVVELPQQVAARRIDPFQLLGLDPNDLLPPAQSHQDQVLDVRYVDTSGRTTSYFGLESEFDWSQVGSLLYGVRDGIAFYLPEDYALSGDVANDPLVDLVDSSLSSKQLRDALLAASPCSTEALVAACLRDPPMSQSDLKSVLDANDPLAPQTLLSAVTSPSLDSSALKDVLLDNSPLPTEVLDAVLLRNPPLSPSDLTKVLTIQ
ncbi:MAG TPA: collagen-binding domain-containing protein [Planctomycetota bacterium]